MQVVEINKETLKIISSTLAANLKYLGQLGLSGADKRPILDPLGQISPALLPVPGESIDQKKVRLAHWIAYDPESGFHTCAECNQSYTQYNPNKATRLLLDHIEATHVKIEAYPCSYCTKRFYTSCSRSRHICKCHQGQHKKWLRLNKL